MTDAASSAPVASDSSSSSQSESDSFDGSPDVKDNDTFDLEDSFDEKPKASKEPKKSKELKGEVNAPKKVERFITVNVNGKEARIPESQLIAEYQKAQSGDERLAKASKLERNNQAFLEALQKNPADILNDPRLPIDRQALALQWLKQQVEEELKDPMDLKLSETERKLKSYEDRDREESERVAQETHQREHQAVVQKIQQNLTEKFSKAMEDSPLSKDPETAAYALREMAIEYRLAKKSGYEPTSEELAQKVQSRYFKSLYSAVQHMSGADLVNFLGKNLTKKLRDHDLEQLRGPVSKEDWPQASRQVESKPSGKQESIDPGDFRQKLRDQY